MNKILVYRGMADDELDNSSKVIIGKYKGESFVDASLRSDILGESWSGILSIGTPSEALLKIAKAQRIPLFCTGTVQTNEDIILSAGIKYYRWWISATDQTYLVARRMIGEIHRMYTSGNNDENEITVRIFYSSSQVDMQNAFKLHFETLSRELIPHIAYKYKPCAYQDTSVNTSIKSILSKGDFVYVTGYGDNYEYILKYAVSNSAVVFTDIALPILCTDMGNNEVHFPPEFKSVRYLSLVNDIDSKNLFQVFVKFSRDRIADCFSAGVFCEEPLHKGVYLLGEKDSIVLRKGGSLAPCLVGKIVNEFGYPAIDENWRAGVDNLVCRLTPIAQVNFMKDTEALVDKCAKIQVVDISDCSLRSFVWEALRHSLLGQYFDLNHVMIFSGEKALFSDTSAEVDIFQKGLLSALEDKPIQVNLREYDLCDNDSYRLFLKCSDDSNLRKFAVPYCQSIEKRFPVVAAWSQEDAAIKFKNSSREAISKMRKRGEALTNWTKDYLKGDDRWVYLVPETSNALDKGCIVFSCKRKLDLIALQLVSNSVNRVFDGVRNAIATNKLKIANTKSAIGSIMSRNGSHNIGSHVLAALSHNIGTMPDDRVLYQYIQHRMDYIATATTEFPTWRQPVLFVSSVMKQFMMQKHLLNFISRSEGLSAYQFQNSAFTNTTQPNTIRLHIRRIHDGVQNWEGRGNYSQSEYDNFIVYGNDNECSLVNDVYVAIPGGIVGQHAFYTILENILRNAAKHEWATTHNKKDHLDFYVDFRDNPVSGKVEFQIWNDRASKDDSKGKGDNNEDITKIVEKLEAQMTCSFIDPEGQLRKENWGLAEMRISAGFLIGSDISLIGGIGVDNKEMLSLIRPVAIKNCEGLDCLGYRFDLYKPKELLIVLPDKVTSGETPKFSEKAVNGLNKLLAQYGVNVLPETKVKDSKGLAYSYVLFDKFNGKVQGKYSLPFRVLYATKKWGMTNEQKDACAIAKYKGSFVDVISELEELSVHSEGCAASAFAYKVLELVYCSWVKHVIDQRCDIAGNPALVVDMKDDGGGGKSLFANANLLYFVFENSFNSAVRSYLAVHTPGTLDPNLAGALYALTKLSPRSQYTAKELREEVDSDDDVANMILVQMVKWADLAKTDERILKGYKTDGEDGLLLPLQDDWSAAGIWQAYFSAWNPRAGLELLLDGLLGNNSTACAEMGDFIKYIGGTILEQARAYLAKYEERFSTLPAWFGMSSEQQDEDSVVWKRKHGDEVFEQKIVFSSNDDKKTTYKKSALCYWRHGDKDAQDNSRSATNDRAIYLEPLSGSQSYLNVFKELYGALSVIQKHSDGKVLNEVDIAKSNGAIRFVTELIENSVMRVLIIDERMKKFADEHPEVASIFVSTGICVLGGEEDMAAELFKAYRAKNDNSSKKVFVKEVNGIPIREFEIVIIHQGIIDKQLEGLDKTTSLADFYVWLKCHMRYVVITTGRGTPPNVPPDARVLPFSVVESTLFKRYPEKLLLVDTVMNMLPIGERSQS